MVNPFTATGGSISRGAGGPSHGDSKRDSAGKDPGGGSGSFEEALKRGSAHAWKGRWEQAVEEYRRALKHSPKDRSARTYLAMALYKCGHLQEGLELYQELWREQPSNLSVLQRMAEVQETMGDLEAAAESHQRLAEIHTRRRASEEAFKAWQKAAALKPDDLTLWNSMMEAAVLAGAVTSMMPSYLKLARRLALEGRFEEAIGVVERGQILDPTNLLMLPLLAAIRGALAYSWRAASQGETPAPEELARLIPDIPSWGEPPPLEAYEPPAPPPPEAAAPLRQEATASTEETERAEAAVVQPEEAVRRPAAPRPEELLPAAAEPTAVEPAEEEAPSSSASPEEEPASDSPPLEVEPESPSPSPTVETDSIPLAEAEGLEEEPRSLEELPGAAEPELEGEPEDSSQASDAVEMDLPEVTEPAEAAAEAAVDLEEGPAEVVAEAAVDLDLQEEPALPEAQEVSDGSGVPEASPGTAIAEQLAELAVAHEQAGQAEQAAEAYGQALELSPHLPSALLGMARLHLAAGELDSAEEKVRHTLEDAASEGVAVQGAAAKLLLDILIGRAVSGDLQAATEGLLWLHATVPAELLPASDVESGAATLAELLGRCGAEHLEELALLPPEVRGEVVLALSKSEGLLREGLFRYAADEMYRLIADQPDFLPAQSLLGKALASLKKLEAAKDRSQRLLDLYEMRGAPAQALEVLWWRVAEGISDGDDRGRLVQLLRAQNRLTEAESIAAG